MRRVLLVAAFAALAFEPALAAEPSIIVSPTDFNPVGYSSDRPLFVASVGAGAVTATYNTPPPTQTAGQSGPLQSSPNGSLYVDLTRSGLMSNSVSLNVTPAYYNGTLPTISNGFQAMTVDKHGQQRVVEGGTDDPLTGLIPVVTQAGTSVLGKASQGNLYSAYAVNASTTVGYLVCVNSASVPASGSAITPVDVAYIGGTAGYTAQINYGAGPPNAYPTGIACIITTSLNTYTPGGNAFIQVRGR